MREESAETDDVTAQQLANVDPNDANASHIAMSASLDGGLMNLAEATDAVEFRALKKVSLYQHCRPLMLWEKSNFPLVVTRIQ